MKRRGAREAETRGGEILRETGGLAREAEPLGEGSGGERHAAAEPVRGCGGGRVDPG